PWVVPLSISMGLMRPFRCRPSYFCGPRAVDWLTITAFEGWGIWGGRK
ncbi:hypothetical protein A2U01_0079199, partial [Trifolium medium]|nr:hypothetical protein [Trifolium medium]